MKGRTIIGMMGGLAFASAAHAGNAPRKESCARPDTRQVEAKRKLSPSELQARVRAVECRNPRPIPAVVDPTPFFVL